MATNPKKQVSSTQEFLAFSEVHDGIVITKNGELKAVVMASSINFSLKSDQEQTAIVYAYQNFINSLDFPLQIMMQSRRLDLGKYMEKLKKTAGTQSNELLRNQTLDYMDFIERLIKMANIMDKKFYVVISYTPTATNTAVPKSSLFGPKKPTATTQITPDQFKKYQQEINQRIQVIQSGLGSIGVRTAQLNTQQIVELMYSIYNPEEAAKERLINFNSLNSDVIESALEKTEDNNE